MEKLLDSLGFFGPQILFIVTIILLWKHHIYWYGYLVFFVVSSLINKIIKITIKQRRPNNGKSILENEEKYYSGMEQYGMPSGHIQSCLYSITYLYLVKPSPIILLFELFIACLTFYQRWKYNRHTIEQLLVGSVVGIMVGYVSFITVKRYWKIQ